MHVINTFQLKSVLDELTFVIIVDIAIKAHTYVLAILCFKMRVSAITFVRKICMFTAIQVFLL